MTFKLVQVDGKIYKLVYETPHTWVLEDDDGHIRVVHDVEPEIQVGDLVRAIGWTNIGVVRRILDGTAWVRFDNGSTERISLDNIALHDSEDADEDEDESEDEDDYLQDIVSDLESVLARLRGLCG